MSHALVVTLIADPTKEIITKEAIGELRDRLAPCAHSLGRDLWLNENVALELPLASISPRRIKECLSEFTKDKPFDWAVLPAANRRKKLLVCDMDSTIIGQECIDELAKAWQIGAKVIAITEQAMRGEIDFKDALHHRVALLEGMPRARLQEVFDNTISLNEGARTLVQTMKQNAAETMLVSGGFTFFTSRIIKAAGFTMHMANQLEIIDDVLTGKVVEPVLDHQAKLDALETTAQKLNLPLESTIAIGDGANDLSMLEAAGLSIGYYAKPVVKEKADVTINHTDLTTALYVQGYRKEEFIDYL